MRRLYGWFIFGRAYLLQRRKKHGKGKQHFFPAIYIALCARWIVDGQWRRVHPPSTKFWWHLDQLVRR